MTNRLFVDTNIVLDAAMAERPQHADAVLLFEEFAYGEAEGLICPLSLKDTYYILSKYADERNARGFILAALDLFTVVNIGYSVCRMAAVSNEPDFEDGLVRACAESAESDFIISRDENAFARSPVKRLSARDYIELFTDTEEIELP